MTHARAVSSLILCCLILALPACGGSPPDPKLTNPQWTYDPDGVKLRYKADMRLNEYDGQGHTVSLCIYQLTQPNSFNNLIKTQDGLLKLLECKSFDQTVVSYEHVFVEPGQDQLKIMDRAENATYLAVVAGYNELNPQLSTRLFKYPVDEETKGFFTTITTRKPGKVFINLFLGPFGIQRVGSQ
jgi:type VI secretion system VasD/TssJ family lipoprotein